MENKENKRTPNFSSMEESTLIGLVSKYKDIIECKKTDAENCRQKKKVWVQLAAEFNSICAGTYRTSDVLLNKYRNIKKRVKKKFADEKCYAQGTGGGPQKKVKITDTDIELKDILGAQVTGLMSEFDDDGVILMVEEESEPVTNNSESEVTEDFSSPSLSQVVVHLIVGPEIPDDGNIFATNKTDVTIKAPDSDLTKSDVLPPTSKCTTDWSSYTPRALKTPKSKCLQTNVSGRNKLSNRLCSWAETKRKTVSLQSKIMVEQHQLFMQQQREKHAAEMRFAEEEHQLKMEILRKQLNG